MLHQKAIKGCVSVGGGGGKRGGGGGVGSQGFLRALALSGSLFSLSLPVL